MGYSSRLYGEIRISPPLKWSEFRDLDIYTNDERDRLLRLRVSELTTNTEVGEVVIRTAVAIEDTLEGESRKCYSLEEELAVIAQTFPMREFSGHVIRAGEENGDIERLTIVNGRLVTEQAILTWPDGSRVSLRAW